MASAPRWASRALCRSFRAMERSVSASSRSSSAAAWAVRASARASSAFACASFASASACRAWPRAVPEPHPVRDGAASQFRIVAGLLSEFLLGLGGFLCLLGGSDVAVALAIATAAAVSAASTGRSLCGLLVCIRHLRSARSTIAASRSACAFANWSAASAPLYLRLRRYPAGHSGFEEGLEVVGEPTLVERSADVEVCRRVQKL